MNNVSSKVLTFMDSAMSFSASGSIHVVTKDARLSLETENGVVTV